MKRLFSIVREYFYRLVRRKKVNAALKRELYYLRGTLK